MSWSKPMYSDRLLPDHVQSYKQQASREAVAITRAASRRPSGFMAGPACTVVTPSGDDTPPPGQGRPAGIRVGYRVLRTPGVGALYSWAPASCFFYFSVSLQKKEGSFIMPEYLLSLVGFLGPEDVFEGPEDAPKTPRRRSAGVHLDPALGLSAIPTGQAITSKASGHQVTSFCTPRTPVTPIRLARNWM